MSSPKDPGYQRAADAQGGGNGSPAKHDAGSIGAGASRPPDQGDVPPWQRGPAARAASNPSPGSASPGGPAPRPPEPRRAPSDESYPRERTEAGRPEARSESYASELPDLSSAVPRSTQPRKPTERPPIESAARTAATSRIQVGTRHKGPVRASMQIRRVDPWSTLKVSLVLSVALFFVWMIAVAFLYLVLGAMGVWTKLNSNVGDLLTSTGGQAGGELVSSGTIFGGAALIGLVNIVLMTAMATVGAFVYNLTTDLVGGVEVTLADRD